MLFIGVSYAVLASVSKILLLLMGILLLCTGIGFAVVFLFETCSYSKLVLFSVFPLQYHKTKLANIYGAIVLATLIFLSWLPTFLPRNSFTQFEANQAIFLCTNDTQYSPGIHPLTSNGTILQNRTSCFVSIGLNACPDKIRICDVNEAPNDIYLKFIAPTLTVCFIILIPMCVSVTHLIVKKQVQKIITDRGNGNGEESEMEGLNQPEGSQEDLGTPEPGITPENNMNRTECNNNTDADLELCP